jgi:catechol 2,3-dioxygenase-like lactoylglutathione lyase family enzyme
MADGSRISPFSRLDTVILRVRDIDAASTWYQALLGAAPAWEDAAAGLVVLPVGDGGSLTLWRLEADAPRAAGAGRAGTYPILGVGDAEAAHAFVASHGGAPGAVEAGEGVRYFGFTDPDGNFLEACQVL